jgi:OOP family OmpA-OmpF porin
MKIRGILIASMLWLASAGAAFCQAPVKDHPMVSRFPGSEVVEHNLFDFDEYQMAIGAIADRNKFMKEIHLEGKVTEFMYSTPETASTLEVERAYESALRNSGFQILYSCSGNTCFAPGFNYGYTDGSWGTWCTNCGQPMRYLAAKLSRASGDVYVSLVVEKDHYEGGTWLGIVEAKHMEDGLVRVNAAAMAHDLTETGHATLYGIGKAVVKPESGPALAEIAKVLSAQPQMKLDVVGHTDNVGSTASNLVLSKHRAEAVLDALVAQYHVAEDRLYAAGLGPLAPVASNLSEEGRAKNRRVELVAQ